MDAPFFSIIVPVFNSKKYLKACLDSILTQSFQDFEIIMINDGSVDGSKEIIEGYQATNPRIQLFNQENKGQGEARNVGVDKARGKYLWFVDSDDRITADSLAYLYAQLGSNTDGFMFTCNVIEPLLTEEKDRVNHFKCGFDEDIADGEYSSKDLLEILFKGKMIPLCCNKVFAKELFVKNGFRFTKGIYFEDVLFNTTLINSCKAIQIVKKDLYVYNQHADSTMGSLCTNKHVYSIFTALHEVSQFMKDKGLYHTYELDYCAFYWRQLTFIYYKFLKDADLDKNILFLNELSRSTKDLPLQYFLPVGEEGTDFPFAMLLKVITEYEKMNEEMESMVLESFNFPQEFVDSYM